MPIEQININISSLPPDVALSVNETQSEGAKALGETEEEAAVRKAAEKKIAEKKAELKLGVVQRETFTRQAQNEQKLQAILGGAAGQEAASALSGWNNNPQLQSKLTEAQKNLFREAMVKNPPKAAEAGTALNRLTQTPGFQKAITNSQQMGTLQAGVLAAPAAAEQPAAQILQSRFMQSPKADAQVKNQFLRFGMQQAQKGQLQSLKPAGDMLGTLTGAGISKGAQRAAMNMVARNPNDPAPSVGLDNFVQQPAVRAMPTFARSKATELLAKANAQPELASGFTSLAAAPKFKGLTAENKGRFFSTIGTGRPSEMRALTDKSLMALQSSDFPNRSGQVTKLLSKMSLQVQKGGADGVNTGALIKDAKKSSMPATPTFVPTAGLEGDDLVRARSQNRAQILQYFNQLDKTYDGAEKKLEGAKYFEDVNGLQTLREPPNIDTSSLSPEELAVYQDRRAAAMKRLGDLRKLQQTKSRELRNTRMPPAKRRALQAEKRLQGPQPKYFSPAAGGASAFKAPAAGASLSMASAGLPASPQRAVLAKAGLPDAQLAQVVSQLSVGPMTADKATKVANAIAKLVTAQLLGGASPTGTDSPTEPAATPTQPRSMTMGKTDGWGIQRTFDRDLGAGANRTIVKPPTTDGTSPDLTAEKYTGKMLVKDPSSIRGLDQLFQSSWKDLSKPEAALLKNLGWNQQAWDTKDTTAAKWPMAMATPFMSLTPTQREAVRKLGISAQDWDSRVAAFSAGAPDATPSPTPTPATPQAPVSEDTAHLADTSGSRHAAEAAAASQIATPEEPPEAPASTPDQLLSKAWEDFSPAELRQLKNLGWSEESWTSKGTTANAQWPTSMTTPYADLTPKQRQALSKLGISSKDWDQKVQALKMGKNA
jgi:hypothetical protein